MRIKSLFLGLFLLSSVALQASSSDKARFGVVKSGKNKVYMACQAAEGKTEKCHIYTEKKGEKPEAISREILLVKLDTKRGIVTDYLDRGAKGEKEISPMAYMPVTSLSLGLMAIGGPKFLPLLILSPLDLAAGPVGLMVDGCIRLYKMIQGTYLKKAWETVSGIKKRDSMTLSKNDFKDFVKAIRRSAI